MPTQGFAPAVPGVTSTNGLSPSSVSPMQMVAMMMGQRPQGEDSTTEKMSKIIQLLREVSKDDPRVAMLANDALRLLVEGPQSGPGNMGGASPSPGPMPARRTLFRVRPGSLRK